MKYLYTSIVVLAVLASCSESYKAVDPAAFNKAISGRTDIKSPGELIRIYYGQHETEGNTSLTVEVKNNDDHSHKIELIHTGLADDSQAGMKVVMVAYQEGKTWVVTEIRESWTCHEGRGHTGWSDVPCN